MLLLLLLPVLLHNLPLFAVVVAANFGNEAKGGNDDTANWNAVKCAVVQETKWTRGEGWREIGHWWCRRVEKGKGEDEAGEAKRCASRDSNPGRMRGRHA